MTRRYTISWIIVLFFVVTSFIGCGQQQIPQPQTEPQAQIPIWESVSFPIVTWFGLTEKQLDSTHFKELADAGFTVNFSHLGTPELNKKALDLAQQAGVKIIIGDSRIQPDKPADAAALEKIDQVVADYKDHPALFGYSVRDEPNVSVFENMAAIKKQILSRDSVHLVYVNLFPNYANEKQLGTKTYQEHVDKFMQIFQPQILSYDYYPFTNKGFRDTYYQNMGVIREAALKSGVPFWAFTMSCEIHPPYPSPKESWIRLQLYSDLAYGAKGLQYFTYALPHSSSENFRTAILDDNGKPTYLYDIAKRVNSEIHALESTIKQLKSVDVYHSKPLPKETQPLPKDFFVTEVTGGPMLIGYLQGQYGDNYLLLVNRNYEKKVVFTLSVSKKVTGLMEVPKTEKGEPVVFESKNGKIKLQFKEGDGRLFHVHL